MLGPQVSKVKPVRASDWKDAHLEVNCQLTLNMIELNIELSYTHGPFWNYMYKYVSKL